MTPITPRRILFIRTGGLGDFILSLPVLEALRAKWPRADVEILGRPAISVLARRHCTRISSIDDARFARLFSTTPSEATGPAASFLSSFDLVVSFLGDPVSDFGRRLSSLVRQVLFVGPPNAGRTHACTHFLDALKPLGITGRDRTPRVGLEPEQQAEGERLLYRLGGTPDGGARVIVHPGSGGRHKNWPPQLFAETIRLFRRAGQGVIVLQGEADQQAVCELLPLVEEERVPLVEGLPLPQVAGIIRCSQLVVGNDSGISHLAASLGTPLVCLFGPTDPAVWRPLGKAVQVLTFAEATPERAYNKGLKLLEGHKGHKGQQTT